MKKLLAAPALRVFSFSFVDFALSATVTVLKPEPVQLLPLSDHSSAAYKLPLQPVLHLQLVVG